MRWYENGKKNIKLALQPYGYFSPTIKQSLKQVNKSAWQANYVVSPGPLFKIKTVDINIIGEGKNLKRFNKMKKRVPIKKGDPFSSEKYSRTKNRLLNTANNLGFLEAKLTHSEVQVDLTAKVVHIILTLDTGPRFYFGKITFNHTPFSDSFLRRFVWLKPGEPYSPTKVIKLQQDFTNSGYFQLASISPSQNNNKRTSIPLKINLSPYKSQQYLIGGGFGTDTGVRGTLGVNFRRLTSTGHKFKALVQASQKTNSMLMQYTVPGTNPLTDQYNVTGSIENIKLQGQTNRILKLAAGYTTNKQYWQRTIALTLQHDFNKGPADVADKTTLLYPSIQFLMLSAKNPIKVFNGYRVNLSLLGGIRNLGSNTNFWQIQLGGKIIKSTSFGTRFLLRTNLAYTYAYNKRFLPYSLRFYAGGADSVRGYGFQDLGPGTAMIIASGEIQQRVYGDFYGGVFYDMGNALDKFKKVTDLKRGTGFSLMYLTPVGPIELSLAWQTNDFNVFRHNPIHGWPKIQFTMGQTYDFAQVILQYPLAHYFNSICYFIFVI